MPTDTISSGPSYELEEIVISGSKETKLITVEETGGLRLTGDLNGETPSFMGGGDMLSLLYTLPSVTTAGDLRAALNVRGSPSGSNLFESDGARVFNPLHMLGLYSAFNPAYYKSYDFFPGYKPATAGGVPGAQMQAFSETKPVERVEGKLSAGIIESHGALRIPLSKGRAMLSLGARRSYLGLLFPDILTLGESVLRYGFTDLNLGFSAKFPRDGLLHVSFSGNRDVLYMSNRDGGGRDGDFGWKNMAASAAYSRGISVTSLAFSGISNNFYLDEGGRVIDLPSRMWQLTARQHLSLGNLSLEGDFNFRKSSGQRNVVLDSQATVDGASSSEELNLAALWRRLLAGERLDLSAGVHLSLYHSGRFNTLSLQPRINLGWSPAPDLSLTLSYGRYVKYDRQIEESSVGLPVDFWVCSSKTVRPEDVHSVEIGFTGYIPVIGSTFILQGYYKHISGVTEFGGSILDFLNTGYSPLDNLAEGNGYAAGVSVSLMRQQGRLRGRLSYTYGVARARFERYGGDWIPTAYDRPHDLNVSLSYSILSSLTASASFTFASGAPYTMARFGYMIGENLICEYYPHNSSRLPAYRRLDFSLVWKFGSAKLRQSLGLSVYNILGLHNVLLSYMAYTSEEGITKKEAVMKAVIPSLTYTIEF